MNKRIDSLHWFQENSIVKGNKMNLYKLAFRPKDSYRARVYVTVVAWNPKAAKTMAAKAIKTPSRFLHMYTHRVTKDVRNWKFQRVLKVEEKV